MFGMITSALKATAAIVTIPVAIVKDATAVSGIRDDDCTNTEEEVEKFFENVAGITDPDND